VWEPEADRIIITIISHPTSSVLYSFVKEEKAEMTLLGSPVLKGKAQDAAIHHHHHHHEHF